mmetsp:Transcript_28536/g.69419  ORF Transcript_28536/g.69419 Transcript_28536/m.69419 type:complete len:81 (-) Transcript_28536:87-329(-)
MRRHCRQGGQRWKEQTSWLIYDLTRMTEDCLSFLEIVRRERGGGGRGGRKGSSSSSFDCGREDARTRGYYDSFEPPRFSL